MTITPLLSSVDAKLRNESAAVRAHALRLAFAETLRQVVYSTNVPSIADVALEAALTRAVSDYISAQGKALAEYTGISAARERSETDVASTENK